MKNFIFFMLFSACFSFSYSQVKEIKQTTIFVNWDKTTHLIFPTNIKYFNTVDDFVIADKPEKAENILSVKANKKDFKNPSSLSVATSDGKFYSFSVQYVPSLEDTYLFLDGQQAKKPVLFEVNKNNNTHLIFNAPLRYIDFGNGDFIKADLAENLQNIVRIAALNEFTGETNVSVYTEDNIFYTFDICYNENQRNHNFQIGAKNPESQALLSSEELTDAGKKELLARIDRKGRKIKTLGILKNKIDFSVQNIFVSGNKLIFRFGIENKSNIQYDINYLKFLIVDKKTTKQTASQEQEQPPLFIQDFDNIVKGKIEVKISVGFEKFTIPDDKYFLIEVNENNGGRHILFKLSNDDIINAETI